MNKLFKLSAIAAAVAFTGAAHADPAETKGGIKIKTEDGRFEANIGGRIQFDLYNLQRDEDSTFGSNTLTRQNGTYFRRIYLTLKGKAYGWNYKIEPDFAGDSTNGQTALSASCAAQTASPTPAISCPVGNAPREFAFQDVYLSTKLGPGEIIIGQIKPFRGMEELTSSNDVLMMERPFAGANGIFNGPSREFQQGVFYKGDMDNMTYGLGAFSLRRDNTVITEGVGYNARFTWAPMMNEGSIIHTGLSYSSENPQPTSSNVGNSFTYAGRRGPSVSLGSTSGGEHADTIGVELATAQGPFFAQAEYMQQKLGQATGSDQTVVAYYVQSSWFVTGETKPYKKADGVFGQPKPNSDSGAVEVKARYDYAENQDLPAGSVCSGATDCKVSAITVGANYYVNPNVRFMLDYIMGKQERTGGTAAGSDEPKAITARAQFSF